MFDWFFELESCYRLLQSCAEAAASSHNPSPSETAAVNGSAAAKQQGIHIHIDILFIAIIIIFFFFFLPDTIEGNYLLAGGNGSTATSMMSAEEIFLRDCEILRKDKHELPAVNISDSLNDFCALFLNDNCSFSLKRYILSC